LIYFKENNRLFSQHVARDSPSHFRQLGQQRGVGLHQQQPPQVGEGGSLPRSRQPQVAPASQQSVGLRLQPEELQGLGRLQRTLHLSDSLC